MQLIPTRVGLVLLLGWLPLLPSCLAVTLERERVGRQPSLPELDALLAGSGLAQVGEAGGQAPFTDLTGVLEELGAPLHVAPIGRSATALIYGWRAATHLRASLSLPLAESLSGSLDFSRRRANLDGLMLVFDSSGVLHGSRACRLQGIRDRLAGERPGYDDAWWQASEGMPEGRP